MTLENGGRQGKGADEGMASVDCKLFSIPEASISNNVMDLHQKMLTEAEVRAHHCHLDSANVFPNPAPGLMGLQAVLSPVDVSFFHPGSQILISISHVARDPLSVDSTCNASNGIFGFKASQGQLDLAQVGVHGCFSLQSTECFIERLKGMRDIFPRVHGGHGCDRRSSSLGGRGRTICWYSGFAE